MSETVLRMIRATYPTVEPINVDSKKTRIGTFWAIYVTSKRIIMRPFSISWLWWFALGFLGWALAQNSRWKEAEKNMRLSPDEILKSASKTSEIPNSDIQRITATKWKPIMKRWKPPVIIVETEIERFRIPVHASDMKNLDGHIEVLRKLFGGKLIVE